jgi:hypothetical protein
MPQGSDLRRSTALALVSLGAASEQTIVARPA